jgi:Lar family restriction alleviation protein
MNNDTNLAPCPFCGGSAHREPTGKWCGSFIYCDMCSASINENTEPTAIAAWNHRTTSPVEPVAPILPHPLGWQMLVSEDLERSWLRIAAPNGSEMAFSAERGSLTAQLLQDFGIALDSPPAAPAVQEPVAMAMLFHRIYERLAPEFGYETRVETRTFDPDSPNGKLMIAVCREIYAALAALEAAP